MASPEDANAAARRWTVQPDAVRGVRWLSKHRDGDHWDDLPVVVEQVPWQVVVATDVPLGVPWLGFWPFACLGAAREVAQALGEGRARPGTYMHGLGPCRGATLMIIPGMQPTLRRNQLQPGEAFGYLHGTTTRRYYAAGGAPPATPPPSDWVACGFASSEARVLRLPHWDAGNVGASIPSAPAAPAAPARPLSDLERLEAEVARLRAATVGNRTGADLVAIYAAGQQEQPDRLLGEALRHAQACWTAQVRLKVAQADAQATYQERHRVVCGTDVDDDT